MSISRQPAVIAWDGRGGTRVERCKLTKATGVDSIGAEVSLMVMVWVATAVLLQTSEAAQERVMVPPQPPPIRAPSVDVAWTVALQLSVAVTPVGGGATHWALCNSGQRSTM